MSQHFSTPIAVTDPVVAEALINEKQRQQNQIELIASENIVSRAVLDALGHEMGCDLHMVHFSHMAHFVPYRNFCQG